MSSGRRLWIGLAVLLAVSFSVLLWVGREIQRVMPPIPAAVVTYAGDTVFTVAAVSAVSAAATIRGWP